MGDVRSRLNRLHRRLSPAGLFAAWQEVLTVMNHRWAWGWTPTEVEAAARAAATRARMPGDVLAAALVAAAQRGDGGE